MPLAIGLVLVARDVSHRDAGVGDVARGELVEGGLLPLALKSPRSISWRRCARSRSASFRLPSVVSQRRLPFWS
jgi:hypothetical protein